ncbi:MAG: Hsp70 family protein [Candidatus Moraniibacteriota bacterium]
MTSQQNIQIGIDLGTTNSSIAINNSGNIEIIKKPGGVEYTPSVFGFDKAGNKMVGQKAYDNLYKNASEDDVKNYKSEVKRLMGTPETFYFERPNVKMTPDEISAEILKNLKEDILKKYPSFNTEAAVITIPAAFSVLQSEATKRAGNLAGFKHVVLLQEPIAAAVAYGFANTENENWLIYDFGGGTFDVALISSKQRVLSVLGHNGDNFLGGKNFDWEIVDKVIVPKILEKFTLNDFNRNNEKWTTAFSQLKGIAEATKIELSEYDKTSILVENIGNDDSGKEIFLTIDFSRNAFENLIEPMIDRTIELSKETLKEAGIKSSSISKVILVGGPTQIPYIRERIERDLKITVDASVDPLTVVARGACVFGMSQKIPMEIINKDGIGIEKGTHSIALHYESLTSDTEETITGIVDDIKGVAEDFYIQIQSESGFYAGQKIKLKNGKFFDTIAVEPNKSNIYWIYLFDENGNSLPVDPDSFTITQGLSVSRAPIPHSIGIVLAEKNSKNNFVLTNAREKIFEKGSTLPCEHEGTYYTVRKLSKNEVNNSLKILIDEGESDMPDRNSYVCELGIKGIDLPYDLPERTEVEINVEYNESREILVNAYIPLIDLTLNARSTSWDEVIDVKEMQSELNEQVEKTKTLLETCSHEERSRVDNEIQSVSRSLKNANHDEDEKRKANKQLKDLKITLDKLDKEKEMPKLIRDFNSSVEGVQEIIAEIGDEKDKLQHEDQLKQMKSEGMEAIDKNDKVLLARVNEQVKDLGRKVLFSNPATWVYQFHKILDEGMGKFINEKEAGYYIEKGNRAIELDDVDELKRCVHNLLLLLPADKQKSIGSTLSGIMR